MRRLLVLVPSSVLVTLAGCNAGDTSHSDASMYTPSLPGPVSGPGNGQGGTGNPGVDGRPIVNAGRNQTADSNVLLMLVGEVNPAPGAAIREVKWEQIAGPSVQLLTPNQTTTTVIAPDVRVLSQVSFRLTVVDDLGRTNSDITTLTIMPLNTFVRAIGDVAAEGSGSVNFLIQLNQASSQPVTVRYETEDGTAVAGQDYQQASGEVVINPGETSAVIPVVILNDSDMESDKSFSLRIVGVVGGEIATSKAVAVISDDDTAPEMLTVQGRIDDYPAQKRSANHVPAINGYSFTPPQDLILEFNGEQVAVSDEDGSFQFSMPATIGSSYTARIVQQPGKLQCELANPSGPISGGEWQLDVQCQRPDQFLENISQLFAGPEITCALDGSGMHCWGNLRDDELATLNNPTAIAFGGGHTCALDDDGAKCWGENDYGQATIPDNLSNPSAIAAGYAHTCVLDGPSVQCWGDSYYFNGQPDLDDPRAIAVGDYQTCALDNAGVHCWGGNSYGQASVPTLSNPIAIAAAGRQACALDDSGVRCWDGEVVTDVESFSISNPTALTVGDSYPDYHICVSNSSEMECRGPNTWSQATAPVFFDPVGIFSGDRICLQSSAGAYCGGAKVDGPSLEGLAAIYQFGEFDSETPVNTFAGCYLDNHSVQCTEHLDNVPEMVSPRELSVSWSQACALDAEGVVCWDDYGAAPVPPLNNPSAVASSESFNCALDDEGLKCWDDASYISGIQSLNNPSKIAAGGNTICAIDDEGLACWSLDGYGQAMVVPAPEIANPSDVTVADAEICAINESRAVCSAWNGERVRTIELDNPTAIATSYEQSCAIDQTGIRCW